MKLTGAIILTYIPVIIACALSFRLSINIKIGLVILSCLLGLVFNILTIAGFLAVILFSSFCYLFKYSQQKYIKNITTVLIFIFSILLIVHIVPGFNNPLIIADHAVSANAITFSKHLNLDKIILAILLLTFVVPKAARIKLKPSMQLLSVMTLVFILSFSIGLTTGLVEFDAKLSAILIGWMITNLFFTCYAEEAFFRGFVQQQLANKWQGSAFKDSAVVIFSGLLFGLAHFPAGLTYTIIASIQGIGLSYCYHKTKNIYVPIYLHFTFNLIHFCFFTYPFIG